MSNDELPSNNSLLAMRGIAKSFGEVRALREVDFTVGRHEVRGLLGGNGAGKTTLMNVLYGLYGADGGAIEIDGKPVRIDSPRDAMDAGIGMVHQTFLQIDSFTVAENVALGAQTGLGRANLAPVREQIREIGETFGLKVDPDAVVGELPVGIRQRVEIIKALSRGARLLILDEPTTNLTPQEVDVLFAAIEKMVAEGVSVVLITHKIRETMAICHQLTVMRDGSVVGTYDRKEIEPHELAAILAGDAADGKDATALDPRTRLEVSEEAQQDRDALVEVDHVSADGDFGRQAVDDVSFTMRPGEVLGIAGVAGNGQVELAEALAGARTLTSGAVRVDGRDLTGLPTRQWIRSGVVYVPEDRQRDGILPGGTVAENLMLGNEKNRGRGGLINWREARERAIAAIKDFSIKTPSEQAPAGSLSGGNIQRVILARAFAHDPQLLILHNPTRGLDINSTQFVYDRVRAAAERGCCVLVISEDLDELLALAPTIAVIYNGAIVGTRTGAHIDPYELGVLMTGVEASQA